MFSDRLKRGGEEEEEEKREGSRRGKEGEKQ
jgi:hypothetical protein